MDSREAQVTMLGRILEGQVESFFKSQDVTDKEEVGYLKEAVFLNILANTLIYRTVIERDAGKIPHDKVIERISQRIAHMMNVLPETVEFHISKRVEKKLKP